jgi:hypothetical protein
MKTIRPGGRTRSDAASDSATGAFPGKRTLVEAHGDVAPNVQARPRAPGDRSPTAPEPEKHTALDGAKAQQFGAQLGADFTGVQLHTGDGLAEDHGAAAVAFGRDVHFAPGMLAKGADALLGHELVHTVQQGAVPTRGGAPPQVPPMRPRPRPRYLAPRQRAARRVASASVRRRRSSASRATDRRTRRRTQIQRSTPRRPMPCSRPGRNPCRGAPPVPTRGRPSWVQAGRPGQRPLERASPRQASPR